MAAPRLSDAQRQELVSRFRAGSSTQELADTFGCSPNTVIRVVKAALEPSLYDSLKRQRSRRSLVTSTAADASGSLEGESADSCGTESAPTAVPASDALALDPIEEPSVEAPDEGERRDREGTMGLAIDDADDFDAAEADDESEEDPEDDVDTSGEFSAAHTFVEVPVALDALLEQPLVTPRPWDGAELPTSVYMLVDKTVELQARPLSEITELGRLAPEELDLQALVLYSNPRQAKRQCGRTQRVIKLPDTAIFERTACYLRRQGIQRLVIEGSLYALPQS
jgi:hypothetical protein